MRNFPTKEELEIDRKIAYNQKMSKSMIRVGFSILALIGIVGLQFIVIHYSVKPVLKPDMPKQSNKTAWHNNISDIQMGHEDNGVWGFPVKLNKELLNHSRIPENIEP